jgi:hypothetical protein
MPEFPSWQPLEGGSVPIPEGASGDGVVALVAAAGAVRGGWAAEAALDLARAWSASGRKVVLADAALDRPALHVAAGLDNGEGLSDASLYGASVRRVARPVDGGAFFVVTAGSPVADASAVARSPRWQRLCDGFGEAGVTLILFIRDGDSGCEAFLASVSDVIVFAERGEAPPAVLASRASMVRAVTGPGSAVPGRPPPAASTSTPGAARPPGAGAPSPGTGTPRAAGDPAGTPAPASARPTAAHRSPPVRGRYGKPKAPSRKPQVLVAVLVIVLALVVLALLGIIDIPMISPEPAGAAAGPLAGATSVAE